MRRWADLLQYRDAADAHPHDQGRAFDPIDPIDPISHRRTKPPQAMLAGASRGLGRN
jgi:hypothetical protein